MLYTMMRRYAGRLETGAMIKTLAKLLVAGALLAAICLLAQHFIFVSPSWHRACGESSSESCSPIAVGGGAFFGAAYLLHVAELRDVVALVRGRLSRLRA